MAYNLKLCLVLAVVYVAYFVDTKSMAPKTMAPKMMAPKMMAPKIMAPKMMAPKMMAPKMMAPKSIAPKSMAPKRTPSSRIYYGTVADNHYSPMSYLQTKMPGEADGIVEQCGGTVISKTCILTAAHCIVDHDSAETAPDDATSAILGANDPTQGVLYQSKKLIAHEDYKPPGSMLNDIAMIILNKEISESDATPVRLTQTTSPDGYADQQVLLIGWGMTEKGEGSDVLLQGNITLSNNHECASLQSNSPEEQESRLCADIHSGPGVTEVGKGDSGGPIFIGPTFDTLVQVGLVSEDVNLTYKDDQGEITKIVRNDVFTSVGYFYDWIVENCPDYEEPIAK